MNLAVIGCGDAARTVVLASRLVRGVRLVAFADTNRLRAERLARRFRGAVAAERWEELLAMESVEAVYLAVPHVLHEELTVASVSAGKAVLLEKPLAGSVASAERLLEATASEEGQSARPKIGVNYQMRYDPRAWALVEAARAGLLGEIAYITVDVPWYRTEAYFENAPWHRSRDMAGGGTLLTQGSHALDIAMLCAGSHPVVASGRVYQRVHADTEVEDLAVGTIEMSSGVPVIVTSSMVARPGFLVRIAVYGSLGSVIYSGPGSPRLRSYGVRLAVPPALSELSGYVGAVRGFRRWVEQGEPFRCPAAEALPVLRAVDAVYRSASLGRTVRIEEMGA